MLVAVGGLFTSCIDNEEPLGVKELRYAKAEYIRALKGLTDANAKVAEAEAAWKNAQADVEKANAAWVTAQIALTEAEAEGQRLKNEADSLKAAADRLQLEIDRALAQGKNAAELEKLRLENEKLASDVAVKVAMNNAKIEEIQNKQKVQAVKAQEDLAVANANLQNTLDSIAAYAMLLSEDEGNVVIIATNTYLAALAIYNEALNDYTEQVAQTYIDTYDAKNLSKEYLRKELEDAKAALEKAKENKEKYAAVDGKAETWKAELDDLKDQVTELEKQKLDVAAEGAHAFAQYRMCFEAFREKIQDLTKEYIEKYMDVNIFLEAEVEIPAPNVNHFIMDQWADYTWPFVDGGILDYYMDEDGKFHMTIDAPFMMTEGVLYSETEPVGLKEIIETFRREKVIVDNEAMAKALADAQQAKKDADSIYFAHKAILEAGLMAYKPVADAAAALKDANDKLTAAQAAYDKAKSDSATAQAAALTTYKADTTQAGKDYRAALKNADDTYDAAVAAAKQKQLDDSAAIADAAKEFAYDINYFFGTIGGGDMDTTKVFAAIKKYAEFISQYNTKQDTIFYYDGLTADNEPIVKGKPIQDLTLEDMTATGLVGKFAYTGNFMPNAGTVGIPEAEIFAHVIRVLVYDNSFNKSTDITAANLKVYQNGVLVPLQDLADAKVDPSDPDYTAALAAAATARDKAKADALTAYNKALTDALKAYNDVLAAEHAKVADALSKLNAANAAVATAQTNLKKAKDEFYAIYDSFWGYNDGTHKVASYDKCTAFADPADSLTVVYTEKTFVDPDNIVKVNFTFDGLLNHNEELAIVLYNLGYSRTPSLTMTDFFNDPTLSYIFYNDKYNEFADRFFAQALLDFYSMYETNLAVLDALEAAVNQLCEQYQAKVTEMEAALNELVADAVELTGLDEEVVKEDPALAAQMILAAASVGAPGYMVEDFIDDFVNVLTGEYVYNNIPAKMLWGEPYPVGGKILEVMKECMNLDGDDFAAKYSEWMNAEHDLQGEINDLNNLIKWLDDIYAAALELEAPGTAAIAEGTKYDDLYKALMEKLDKDIEDAEWDVYELQKLVDTMDAGADYLTVAAEIAEQKLQHAKDVLDVAKTNLDAAKATYDEVIAKYLNK